MSAIEIAETRAAFEAIHAETGTTAKGRLYESLAANLLDSLKGVSVPERNQLAALGVEEIDLLAVNEQGGSDLPGFQRDILVSCKAERKKTSTEDIRLFADSLSERNMEYGFLFTLDGVSSGKGEGRYGDAAISNLARKGRRILVFTQAELEGIRSADHLAVVIERKRQRMSSSLRAVTFDDDEIKELDPGRGFNRGLSFETLRKVAIRERVSRLDELRRQEATTGSTDRGVVLENLRGRFDKLGEVADAHDPEEDWFYRTVYAELLLTGRAILDLLAIGADEDVNQQVEFNVARLPKLAIRTFSGSQLWRMLTNYYLDEIADSTETAVEDSCFSLLCLVIEEMSAIHDIDPPYDDWPGES